MKHELTCVSGALTRRIGAAAAEARGFTIRPVPTVDECTRRMLTGTSAAGEMSLATYLRARERGAPLIAMPIVTGARFLEPGMGARPDAGITSPSLLAGRKVGIPQFWMTSSVWNRAILKARHGVPASAVHWVTVQPERFDKLEFPRGVSVEQRIGGNLAALLQSREIDAVLYPRPIADHFDRAIAVPIFGDLEGAQRAFYAAFGFVPLLHLVVLHEELFVSVREAAAQLLALFRDAKHLALACDDGLDLTDLPLYGADVRVNRALLGSDPWPFSLAGYSPALSWFLDHARAQGLLERVPPVEALFVPELQGASA